MARPSKEETLRRQEMQTQIPQPQISDMQETVNTPQVATEQTTVSKFGNLDKKAESALPKGFNVKDDYYIKHWEVQMMNDNSFAVLTNTIDYAVYPSEDFQAHFQGYESGAKTLFESVTGKKYEVLHDPTK